MSSSVLSLATAPLRVALRRRAHGPLLASWSYKEELTSEMLRPLVTAMLTAEPPSRGRWLGGALAVPGGSKRLVRRRDEISGVPGEWTLPDGASSSSTAPVVLHLHGGGYVIGSARASRSFTGAIALSSGLRVFSADYRLAPEHPFPAALEDAVRCVRGLRSLGTTLVIGGESAGGGLALAALMRLRDDGGEMPAGAFLVSPWTDLVLSAKSLSENRPYDYLAPEALERCARLYASGRDRADPLISPRFGDLRGLCPLLVQVGSVEVLRDDGIHVADGVRACGGRVDVDLGVERVHVWPLLPGEPQAKAAIRRICDFVRAVSCTDQVRV